MQHKQSRELYALKYINKTKCVKMKAVANIIQERRLLEEVSFMLFMPCHSHSITNGVCGVDRPSICSELAVCVSG